MPETENAVPRLLVSDYDFAPEDRERLAAALGRDGLLVVDGADALHAALVAHPEAEVVSSFHPPADLLALAPGVRWLAQPSAGADQLFRAGLVREGGPIVTTANGIHAVPISEFVFSVMLLWAKHWRELLARQRAHEWLDGQRGAIAGRELCGATLGIVGLGAIGRRVAQLGGCFGMQVVATRRSARPGDADADAQLMLPMDQLDTLLAQSDYVVVAVPNTDATHHLIGGPQFRAMKPSAFFVNIARGAVVDEPALVRALRDGQIAGAGLDVFETEPLPPDSPLWAMPNVFIAPHISGASAAYSRRFTDLLLDNLARYRAGQPLRNVVQAERGY
ncbi:MAG: D-2-hydroxyacid dehydrogenase [Ktedonobacterales bacterium]